MSSEINERNIKYQATLWTNPDIVQGDISVYIDEEYTHFISVYVYEPDFEKVYYNFSGQDYSTKDALFASLKDNHIYCEQLEVSYLTLCDNLKEPTELFWQFYVNQNIFNLNNSTEIEYD